MTRILFLAIPWALLAQPIPPIRIDLPDLPDIEVNLSHLANLHLDLQVRHEDLAGLGEKINTTIHEKINTKMREKLDGRLHEKIREDVHHKIAAAMDRVNYKRPVFAAQAAAHGWGSADRDSDRAYERGLRALDSRRYELALDAFAQAGSSGPHADAALYWKAYALHRLNRRAEAVTAVAELRKAHASSRWLAAAQALESEVKQASGQKTPEQWDADDDMKIIALSGLMRSDPEKASPIAEQILRSASSRKLKEQALRELAGSDSPRHRELVAQVARGRVGDPDLQLRAIRNLSSRRHDNRPLVREIYANASDPVVKRAALRALASSEDTEEMLRIAKAEKDASLRKDAISHLGNSATSAQLWALYQSETSLDVKEAILHRLREAGGSDRLAEIAKSDKEPSLRKAAIRGLGAGASGDALVALYSAESDTSVKRAIVDALHARKNAKALVALARANTDPQVRRDIVARLSRMDSPEASAYLAELLK